jgi:hypothetical protein
MFCMREEEAMKKSLIAGAALVACMVVLTCMTGLAQAQNPSSLSTSVAQDEGEAEEIPTDAIAPQFVAPNRCWVGVCTIGPRNGDILFRCFNFGFSNSPPIVFCQTRNHPSQFINFPDQFACQVIGTTSQDNGSVWFRIRRIDDGTGSSGWGQNLQASILVCR